MTTVEERREVARRLREMGEELGSSVLLWYHIAKALGVRTATDGKTACGMLADLIEPQPTCRFYDPEDDMCLNVRTARPCDRAALVVLARNLDLLALMVNSHELTNAGQIAGTCQNIANGIREALGAVE